ncbi:hypothetical protein [Capybara microvirus Cap3_SP_363]|nr:hypothetical protein [Capybara microvirus Cap3_SP_363]
MLTQTLNIRNNTHYFCPSGSRLINSVINPSTERYKSLRVQGYNQRLYYEYTYCKSKNYPVFSYTLTYNNKSLPMFYGNAVHDYNDIRYFFRESGFDKHLLRHYGSVVKYFVASELGEGGISHQDSLSHNNKRAQRGKDNNPHYHVIFFVYNANDTRYPYIRINGKQFKTIVQRYWQGDAWRTKKPQEYKFGIAMNAKYNLGEITNGSAIRYNSKYVVKDVLQSRKDDSCLRSCEEYWNSVDGEYFITHHKLFWDDYFDRYVNDFASDVEYINGISDVFGGFHYEVADFSGMSENELYDAYVYIYGDRVNFDNLLTEHRDYIIDLEINRYKNRHRTKVKISNGIGLSALDKMVDGKIPMPVDSKKIKMQYADIYYYRKMYYDVEKDINGNSRYVINYKGIEFRKKNLLNELDKLQLKVRNCISLVSNSLELQDRFKEHYLKCSRDFYFENFDKNVVLLNFSDYLYINNIDNFIEKYAYYSKIYRNRLFRQFDDNFVPLSSYVAIDPISDYGRFIECRVYDEDYTDCFYDRQRHHRLHLYAEYIKHPYFQEIACLCGFFDCIQDFVDKLKDEKQRKDREERERVKANAYSCGLL